MESATIAPALGIVARAAVERVIDGDTLDVVLHLPVRVRLLNCWADELGTEAGREAKSALESFLPVGSRVVVSVPTSEASRMGDVLTFGRVLGDVYREGEELTVSELMVQAGHASDTKNSH